MNNQLRRRDFIRQSTATLAASAYFSGFTSYSQALSSSRPVSANNKIVLGFIGMGRQGQFNLKTFKTHADVEVAAVCDVYEPHLKAALAITEGKAKPVKDFRNVLEMKEIDAVVVSSPDHWHPLHTILACQAGKDVYVEKPISVYLHEGRLMVNATRKYNRVVQVGTQQRSGVHFQRAIELLHQGYIGKVSFVRTWNFGNTFPEGIGNPPDTDPPPDLDWDLWLGPAKKVRFNTNRFGVLPERWSTFRYFWDYAGGMMTDWGVHLLDIVQWGMNVDAPLSITAQGGKLYLQDNRETPDTLQVTYEYPGFVCVYENRECNGLKMDGQNYGIQFHGTLGTLYINRAGFEVFPEKDKDGVDRCKALMVENSNKHNNDHSRNFLDCVASRKRPICDIEVGHRSTSVAQLGNISYRTKSHLFWDSHKERFQGNRSADRYLAANYRKPWKLSI
jgi:predicted dehydrogenase